MSKSDLVKDGYEYDEDDFETYDDDFEAEESAIVAPAKTSSPEGHKLLSAGTLQRNELKSYAKESSSKSEKSFTIIADVDKRPSQLPQEASDKSGRSKKFENLGISLAHSISDPRAVRVKRIFQSGILEMEVEKATLLNIPPITKFDLYLSSLRSQSSNLRQIGVPIDIDFRDIEVNTEEVLQKHNEVQYCYGDDTKILNIMAAVKSKNKTKNESFEVGYFSNKSGSAEILNSGLSNFMQRAGYMLDTILHEKDRGSEFSLNYHGSKSLINDAAIVKLGQDSANGGNELLRSRRTSMARFSTLNSNLVATAHPYPTDINADIDLRPFKGLYAIWDSSMPGSPRFILEGSGQSARVCFSSVQAFVLVGGTEEGTLHLWDLREPSILHKDKDSIDLGISQGIRKPSYSTHLQTDDGDERILHSAPIVLIESIGASSNTPGLLSMTSQFVSLDEMGNVIFWITSDLSESSQIADSLCVSPWSKIFLLATRRLSIGATAGIYHGPSKNRDPQASSNFGSIGNSAEINIGLQFSKSVAAVIPNDPSTLLFGGSSDELLRIARIGEAPLPNVYKRHQANVSLVGNSNTNSGVSYLRTSSSISCISVRHTPESQDASNSFFPPLFLIGRDDGTVDMHQMDRSSPIITWSLSNNLQKSGKGEGLIGSGGVVMVSWINHSSPCFIAVDASGVVFYYNISTDLYLPLHTESLGVSYPVSRRHIDISQSRSGLESVQIVVCDSCAPNTSLRVYKLCLPVEKASDDANSQHDESLFRQRLSHSTIETAETKNILYDSKAISKQEKK